MSDLDLVLFFDEDHRYDDMNTRCECGWSWASDESYGEHLSAAIRDAGYVLVKVPEGAELPAALSAPRGSLLLSALNNTATIDISGITMNAGDAVDKPYPPNTMCACGDLIHPDMPYVWVEADGALWHGNPDGGGHHSDVPV